MCPGWLAGAGLLRAALPPGTPAWPQVEPRKTAARSERQVDRQRRQKESELGVVCVGGWGRSKKRRRRRERKERGGEKEKEKKKGDMNK